MRLERVDAGSESGGDMGSSATKPEDSLIRKRGPR